MIRLLIILLWFLPTLTDLFGQNSYSVTVDYGLEIQLEIDVDGTIHGYNKLSGMIELSNTSLFYPDSFSKGSNTSLNTDEFVQIDDSLFSFKLDFEQNDQGSGVILFNGLTLAGYDTLCIIRFYNLKLNDSSLPDFEIYLKFRPLAGGRYYARFTQLGDVYPNPVPPGGLISADYYIDKQTDVEIKLYSIEGKYIDGIKYPDVPPGVNHFSIPAGFLSAGVYYLTLRTKIGRDRKKFIIGE